MKYLLSKISHLTIQADSISVKAVFALDGDKSGIRDAPSVLFCTDSREIPCRFISLTEKKESSVLLQFAKSIDVVLVLFNYVGNEVNNCYLLTEEVVPPDLYKETFDLLKQAAIKTGRSESDLLFELTEFKKGAGKKELKYVSEKQMVIIRDKLKIITLSHNNDVAMS